MSKLKILIIIFLLAFSVNALMATPATAQISDPTIWESQAQKAAGQVYQTTEPQLIETIGAVIKVILGFLGVILLILIIYGGFLWMTSAGEEEKVSKAKKIIGSAAVGVLIIVIAYTLTFFILDRLIDISTPATVEP